MNVDWSKYLTVDSSELNKYIRFHSLTNNVKLKVRFYSVEFKGNLLDVSPFSEYLSELIHSFVYSSKQVKDMGLVKARGRAAKYFGGGDINSNGKYGELILYVLIEAILKCPIISFKIRALSNLINQVNGGDGIFVGEYEVADGQKQSVLLIGESKVTEQLSKGLDEAFKSIERFHGTSQTSFNSTEMLVAKEHLRLDLDTEEELDTLYNMLTFGTEEFNNNVLAHPILIIYNLNSIHKFESTCTSKDQIEKELSDYLAKRQEAIVKMIDRKLASYPEVRKVALDFFIIPVKEVNLLRRALYYHIHGEEYKD